MKRINWLVLICVLLISISGCGNKEAKNTADEAADVLSSGDIDAISRLILGTNELIMDSEIKGLIDNVNESQTGVMSCIFTHNKVTVKKVGKDMIKFKISAPDMENVFKNLPNNSGEFAEDDLLNYIEEYVDKAEKKNFLVSVPYTDRDGQIVIDYHNEDFINAISGGLLEVYKQLYTDMLNEYKKGVS